MKSNPFIATVLFFALGLGTSGARADTTYTYASSLLTGSVTFNFDTTNASGDFANSISNLQIGGIPYY